MPPLLSVIIPVYNTSAFLEKCVNSVLKQNVDMEIILIDDGSPDDAPALCDRLALGDPRIIVIHQNNAGLSSARNKALDICKGKYITFVDSDDELLENTYRPNLEILERDEHITAVQFPYIYPYNQPNPRRIADSAQAWEGEEDILTAYMLKTNHPVWNKIFRRSVFAHLRFPEGINYEDSYIVPDLAKEISCFYSSGLGGGYGYNFRPDSITGSGLTHKKRQDCFLAYERIIHAASDYPALRASSLFIDCYHLCFLITIGINKTRCPVSSRYKDSFNRFRTVSCPISSIFRAKNLPTKEKIRLLLLKILGISFYLKYLS